MIDEWVQSIDDIRIVCKNCMRIMVMESDRNDDNAIFVCNKCKRHIKVKVCR